MTNKFLSYQEAWLKSDRRPWDFVYNPRRIFKLQMTAIRCIKQCLIKGGSAVTVFNSNKENAKEFLEKYVISVAEKMGIDTQNISIKNFEDVFTIMFENGSIIISAPAGSHKSINEILEKWQHEYPQA
jgi:phage FluMu gp28-like protein